ncbi:MAG: TolC family protein [Candidatus Krumholzibacteriia bacterium]|nr:TolC family protein [Candidatus Latescibacterota bacterium]
MSRCRASLRTCLLLLLTLSVAQVPSATRAETLDLDQCLTLAFQHSPELASARQQLLSSRAGVLGAYGSFLPSFSTSIGYGHQFVGPKPASTQYNTITQQFFIQDPIQSRDYETYSFNLSGDLTLFSGFSRWASLAGQKFTLAAGEAEFERTRGDVESAVVKAYYDLARAQLLVELKQSTLEANLEQHDQTRRSFAMGAVARSDTLRSGVQAAEAQLGLLEAQNSHALARVALATLIGADTQAPLDVVSPALDRFATVSREDALQAAIDHDPTLRAAGFRSDAAEQNLRQAKSGLYPSIGANYRFGWSNLSPPDEVLTVFTEDYSYSLSLGMSWNLFDRFQTKRGIQQARASYHQQQYAVDQQRRNLIQQVENILVTLENARQRVLLARATISLAQEDLRLARERYRVGAATLLEVSQAEVSLVQGRSSEIDGVTGYLSAVAELERATGWSLSR